MAEIREGNRVKWGQIIRLISGQNTGETSAGGVDCADKTELINQIKHQTR